MEMSLRSLGFCALALVALLGATGCGSSSKDKSTDTGAQRPTRGFQSDDYKPVGIHITYPGCSSDYADGNGGCSGTFVDAPGTTPPFISKQPGRVSWETHPFAKGAKPSPNEPGIIIRFRTDSGHLVECGVVARNRAECYTGGGQTGIDAGKEGGPLKIDAEAGGCSTGPDGGRDCRDSFVDLHGFCRKDNDGCNVSGRAASGKKD
jgi:hypothetical protein